MWVSGGRDARWQRTARALLCARSRQATFHNNEAHPARWYRQVGGEGLTQGGLLSPTVARQHLSAPLVEHGGSGVELVEREP